MRYLALDIGTRRTGVAFYSDETKIVMPLDTIEHASFDELFDAVKKLVADRSIDSIVIGLPLLPSGSEGSQANVVRQFVSRLEKVHIAHSFLDERYTTPRSTHSDGNADAACSLLQMAISRQ